MAVLPELTDRQSELLHAFILHLDTHMRSPSERELAMRTGLPRISVRRRTKELVSLGMLEYTGGHRGVMVTARAWEIVTNHRPPSGWLTERDWRMMVEKADELQRQGDADLIAGLCREHGVTTKALWVRARKAGIEPMWGKGDE